MATTKPRTRKTAAQRRAEAAASTFGVLPQPTAAQRAAMDPRNDPGVRKILAALEDGTFYE